MHDVQVEKHISAEMIHSFHKCILLSQLKSFFPTFQTNLTCPLYFKLLVLVRQQDYC